MNWWVSPLSHQHPFPNVYAKMKICQPTMNAMMRKEFPPNWVTAIPPTTPHHRLIEQGNPDDVDVRLIIVTFQWYCSNSWNTSPHSYLWEVVVVAFQCTWKCISQCLHNQYIYISMFLGAMIQTTQEREAGRPYSCRRSTRGGSYETHKAWLQILATKFLPNG